MIYLRELKSDAWMDVVTKDREALDSDVISDLSTTDHELSVWQVDDNLSKIDDVALAMALSRDQVKGLTLVKLSSDKMRDSRSFGRLPEIQEQRGKTAYQSMADYHKNIMINSLWEMGYLAEHIADLISTDFDKNCTLYNSQDILHLLNERIKDGTLEESYLKSNKAGAWVKAAKAKREAESSANQADKH